MKKPLYLTVCLVFLGIQFLIPGQAMAQEPEISSQFIQTAKKRISRSVYEYTFQATLINHDLAIKNVSATVTSSSPNTTIMDDDTVSFNDVAVNETVESTDTFVLRQNRTQAFNSDDLAWNISYEPDLPPVSANVHVNLVDMSNSGRFIMDKFKGLTTIINFRSSEGNTPFTIRISQTIEPATGLSLSPILDGEEFTYSKNTTDKHKQLVRATAPGIYKVTTTATIVETGDSSTRTYTYEVLPSGSPELFIPSPDVDFQTRGHPMVLRPGMITPIAFGMGSATGSDHDTITGIRVIVPELGMEVTLNDEGIGSDDDADDRVYGSQFVDIDTSSMATGDCLSYYAIVTTPKGEVTSKPGFKLCVSNLPAMPFPIEKDYWENEVGRSYARNVISVHFKEGVLEARMIEIADSIGGDIVGGMPFTNDYTIQLRQIPSSSDARSILSQKIRQLNGYPEVLRAGRVIGGSILSSYTDDTLYQSLSEYYAQGSISIPAISLARTDEAWYVAQGTARIAIIDSGVDKDHQDLSGKVVADEGFNWAELNFDTDDYHHHGSHVAGIAAAQPNNGIGIAGVSWLSEILPIKIYPDDDGSGASIDAMVGAIYHAAGNEKTKIINFSSGFEIGNISFQCRIDSLLNGLNGETPISCINDNLEELDAMIRICNAVKQATNVKEKIFIAAVGNTVGTKLMYPAACPEAIAVAAIQTDDFDNLKKWEQDVLGFDSPFGSRSGDWVDIAAPGYQVMSTVPPLSCFKDFLAPQQFLVADACYDFTNGYRRISGTSEAAPFVAGAAAAIMAKNSDLSINEVKERLIGSAIPLANEDLGAGALNVFEAVFNGNFELVKADSNQPEEWEKFNAATKACDAKQEASGLLPILDEINPDRNRHMLVCDNTSVYSAGSMNTLDIPEGVTELPLSFDWRIMAEDLRETGLPGGNVLDCGYELVYVYYPYFHATYQYRCHYKFMPRNDFVLVQLIKNDDSNQRIELFKTSLAELDKSSLSRMGANNWLANDWQHFSKTVPITTGAGEYILRIQITHSGFNSFSGSASTSLEGSSLFMMDHLAFRDS